MIVQVAKVPGNREALALARPLAPSESERWLYFESQKEYWNNYNVMTTALSKGRSEGKAEGLAEGRALEKLNNACNLKANGVPVELIANRLGLAEEEVEKL